MASSLLATLTLLADGGVVTGVTALGGRLYDRPKVFARLIQDGLRVSARLSVLSFVLTAPFFYSLYKALDTPVWIACGVLILGAAAIWPMSAALLLNAANRLHKRIHEIQMSEFVGGVTRLALTTTVLACGAFSVLPVMAAAVAAAWVQALIVWSGTKAYQAFADELPSHVSHLWGFVRSLYGNHIFLCLQAQINTWIIGWLGTSGDLAELGALARLSVLFTALASPFAYLVIPSISRIQDTVLLRRRFLVTFVLSFCLGGGLILLSWWFPMPFLWLLGKNYAHLVIELRLALGSQAAYMIAGMAWASVLARGWVQHAWVTIVTTLLGFGAGAALFPLDTVAGLLLFNMFSVVPTFLFCVWIIVRNLARLETRTTMSKP